MTKLIPALALVAFLAAGCAGHSTYSPDEDALLDCRSQADEHHKARYTDDWEATVQKCLDERAKQ